MLVLEPLQQLFFWLKVKTDKLLKNCDICFSFSPILR